MKKRHIMDLSMEERKKLFAEAGRAAVAEVFRLGLPVTGAKDGRVVKIYPDGREVVLKDPGNMRPSTALELERDLIRAIIEDSNVTNPRVFGSVLHGTDTVDSDLDILVDPGPGTTLFDLAGLEIKLTDLLGVKVHILTPGGLPEKIRDQVISEAKPV